jgi:hypothetical protein
LGVAPREAQNHRVNGQPKRMWLVVSSGAAQIGHPLLAATRIFLRSRLLRHLMRSLTASHPKNFNLDRAQLPQMKAWCPSWTPQRCMAYKGQRCRAFRRPCRRTGGNARRQSCPSELWTGFGGARRVVWRPRWTDAGQGWCRARGRTPVTRRHIEASSARRAPAWRG